MASFLTSETSEANASLSNSTQANGCAVNEANKDFDQISFVIAIALAILAAISNNLGVNFQKLAWTKKQKGTASVRKYRLIWVCGMLGIILASVFDFVALAFGPQSVIAPLGALTMVMNACVAPWMHGERLPRVVFLATFIIVGGCAMAVATASHENIICDLDGIFAF
jgi:drug/metabolite transporter (DMT)-like permease